MHELYNIKSYSIEELRDLNNGVIPAVYYNNGLITSIQGKYTKMLIKDEDDAIKSLYYIKDLFGISNPINEFKLKSITNSGNLIYYRLQQIYNNYLVYSNEIIITTNSKGESLSISGKYSPIISLNINPKLNKQEAIEFAKKYTSGNSNAKYNVNIIIYAYPDNTVKLAWMINYYHPCKFTENLTLFIDAEDGKLISKFPILNT